MFGLFLTSDYVYCLDMRSASTDATSNLSISPFKLLYSGSVPLIAQEFHLSSGLVFHGLFQGLNSEDDQLKLENYRKDSVKASKALADFFQVFFGGWPSSPTGEAKVGKTLVVTSDPPLSARGQALLRETVRLLEFRNFTYVEFSHILALAAPSDAPSRYIHCHIGDNCSRFFEMRKTPLSPSLNVNFETREIKCPQQSQSLSGKLLRTYISQKVSHDLFSNGVTEVSQEYFDSFVKLIAMKAEKLFCGPDSNESELKETFLAKENVSEEDREGNERPVQLIFRKGEYFQFTRDTLPGLLEQILLGFPLDQLDVVDQQSPVSIFFSFDRDRGWNLQDLKVRRRSQKKDDSIPDNLAPSFNLYFSQICKVVTGIAKWFCLNLWNKFRQPNSEKEITYIFPNSEKKTMWGHIGIGCELGFNSSPYFHAIIDKNSPRFGGEGYSMPVDFPSRKNFELKLYEGNFLTLEKNRLIYKKTYDMPLGDKGELKLILHSNFLLEIYAKLSDPSKEEKFEVKDSIQLIPEQWRLNKDKPLLSQEELVEEFNKKVDVFYTLVMLKHQKLSSGARKLEALKAQTLSLLTKVEIFKSQQKGLLSEREAVLHQLMVESEDSGILKSNILEIIRKF